MDTPHLDTATANQPAASLEGIPDDRFPLVGEMPEIVSDSTALWGSVAFSGIGVVCFLYAMFKAFDGHSATLPMMFGFAFVALGRVVSGGSSKKHAEAMERAVDKILDAHGIARDQIDAKHELKWEKSPAGKLVVKLVEKQPKKK